MTPLEQQGRAAKAAARVLAAALCAQKDAALEAIAQAVEARQRPGYDRRSGRRNAPRPAGPAQAGRGADTGHC